MKLDRPTLTSALRLHVALGLMVLLSACAESTKDELQELDTNSLDDIMLSLADPGDSVSYFANSLAQSPNDTVAKRNLAGALARAQRYEEAAGYYGEVVEAGASLGTEDRLTYADALLRIGDWETAQQQMGSVPTSYKSYEKERISAVLADIRKDWATADRHYREARALTIRPAPILNNWGVSKLSRGAFSDAEGKFREAVSFDRELFVAKNNMVIARGRQGNYNLPIIPMTEIEKAQLLHDLAVVALDNGDTVVARNLLQDALDVHPQHFDAAAVKLAGL